MKCAFYEKEITPPIGSDIPGYYMHRYTTGVKDKLYAKAAVFEGDNGKIAAILVLDAVDILTPFQKAVAARVTEFTGIPAEKLAIIANHTHYGIPQGDVISDRDAEFCSVLERLAADCVILAWQRLENCTLSYGIGKEETVAFNRDFVMKDGAVATNVRNKEEIVRPYDGIDPDLPVLVAKNEAGKVMGTLFTYALHQDTTGGVEYSGDYASEISYALKEKFGYQMVSIYLPGCCGDINHLDPIGGTKRGHREIGRTLAGEISRVVKEETEAVTENTVFTAYRSVPMVRRRATKEQIEKAKWILEDTANRTTKYDMTGQNASLMLKYEEAFKDAPKTVDVPVQVFRIGEVWMLIFPFEVYHQFGLRMKAACPGGKWLMSELANITPGYVPVPELFGTDAYPAQLCHGSFLMPEAGDQLVEAIVGLIDKLKEKI